ncbi:flagellar protein export ATPase FliI [bacterium]|nr:flagellar protein export ATPase FliI [FCB group bacterium]MBL7191780.1 flagellar protein export ATPase FliI [bacterium]
MIFARYHQLLGLIDPIRPIGNVVKVVGLVIESEGPSASIGEICLIETNEGKRAAEVVGFRDNRTLLMPLGEMAGLTPGANVTATGSPLKINLGLSMLGRIIGGLGEPLDDKGPLPIEETRDTIAAPPDAVKRRRITESIATGIRSIDAICTLGKGQRMGIFSGSGVGKSIILGMIARNTSADVNVVCLVGERGREVREFLERDLGEEGLKRSVVVVVTSDKPALIRLKGAFIATTIAEYFRDQGADVMLMMDSVTRVAMAQREVGLSVGEPPTTRGYTPSVFALLPKLMERSGSAENGSITALYTVLVEGDDMNEPVADHTRAILDGHIILSRQLASINHYPAVDVIPSISRVMIDVVPEEHMNMARKVKEVIATYREAEDLINIGAYAKGSNKKIDFAISVNDKVNQFLQQEMFDKVDYKQVQEGLLNLF